MPRTQTAYRKLLQSLLPRGPFWTRAESATFTKVLQGFGAELSRVEGRSEDLIDESITNTITELLAEWETDFSIPDPGFDLADSTAGRRAVIQSKLIAIGQQDKGYFEQIAASLGYTITITEFEKCLAGIATAGGYVATPENCLFYWIVNVDVDAEMMEFYTGANIAQLINDVVQRKPGHTIVSFRFTGVEFDFGFSNAFDSQPWYDGSSWPISFSRDFSNAFANAYDYDGERLTGGFDKNFGIGFDSRLGGEFNFDQYSNDFLKPT